jgi:hypothetical protein
MKSKSKKKEVELPVYQISLNFTNNLLQTYIFEIFEKMTIPLNAQAIKIEDFELVNTIHVEHKGEVFLLFLFDRSMVESVDVAYLFKSIEYMLKITKNVNITIIFHEINEEILADRNDMIFFINTELGIKIFECNSNNEFIDYLHHFSDSIITKEEKSKITFFESKPTNTTNLCELEGITDETTLTWIRQLMCIPGISETKAIAVAKVYPNYVSLIEQYNKSGYNEKERESFLKDIEVDNKAKNKTSKLGVALSTKIYKVFNSTDSNIIIN